MSNSFVSAIKFYNNKWHKMENIKNLSFNRIVISLLEFSLDNLDENDRFQLEDLKK